MKSYSSKNIKDFLTKPHFDENIIFSKDNAWPKISVVTPSLNQAPYLEKTILSVLNQNYPNLEYIIIDGASKDGSVEIIKKYEKYLACWESTPDRCHTDALNKGFKRCTGDIIGWQNSDDFYLPNALEKAGQTFMKDSKIDVVFGNRINVDKDENYLFEFKYTPFSFGSLVHEGNIIVNESAFWKRNLFEKVGYLDEKWYFSMDYDFFIRLGLSKARFKHIPEFLAAMHYHSDTKTHNIWDMKITDDKAILKKYGLKRNKILAVFYMMKRAFWYLLYGDIRYVFIGVKRVMRRIGS
ncbi:glycosyltransferase family 2 protein, partial [Candidatus Omnitrophota bacterium]